MKSLAVVFGAALLGSPSLRAAQQVYEFERLRLSDVYFAEGAGMGDFNHDSRMDVVAGPYWYAGPDFKVRHELYAPVEQDRTRYANNFFSFAQDFNRDGWADVLVVGFPGTPASWYENPRRTGVHWTRHEVCDWVSNESPQWVDVVGDNRPELVCTRRSHFGYYAPDWSHPEQPWPFHPISEAVAAERFGHGLGVGDINGDGRHDVICKDGWFLQPESLGQTWDFHEFVFTRAGGAQMFAYDVDGDGDNDVITSLAAHDHGLSWFEQRRQNDKIDFVAHPIMGIGPKENPYGVCFSELHAVELADMDGDGLKDIVTGKTYWSHHTQTSSWHDGAVVYWFKLARVDGQASYVPYRADDDSGIGRQLLAGDLNGDGWPDLLASNMKGTFVLLQHRRDVSQEEWQAAQPRRWKPNEIPGVMPKGADGQPLNLDFESGTLKDWTADGDAFKGQPVEGEIRPTRKWGEGKQARPQGRFWIGGFEVSEADAPRGTLLSAPFTLDMPFASYRIGGGCLNGVRMELIDAGSGAALFTTHGRNNETMLPESVDVRRALGRRVRIRLVDEETSGFGHLNFDDFRLYATEPVFADSPCMLKRLE